MRNPLTQNRARSLRNHATDTERHLWRYLRGHQLGGHRFRRQVPIGNYIADFACLEAKLIIELDGGQHQEQAEYDAHRDMQIEAQGFRVLRFWDNQVFQETQAVLEVILQALEERAFPHPNPPPQAEEGVSTPRAGEGANTQAGEGVEAPSLARSAGLLPPLHAQRAGEGWGGGNNQEPSAKNHPNSQTAEQVHNAP